MNEPRIVISGGGTGGHIFPAVAIAKTIQSVRPDAEILFVGAEGKMEMEKVPAAGFKIIGLPIVGIQRRLTWKNLLVPFKLLASMLKAKKIIKEFKPDIAIGVGGYASGPLLKAACNAGIKTLIQEQNSYPGITNKILSRQVNRICVAYQDMDKFFPAEKIVLTGNPVRPEVAKLEGKKARAVEQFGLSPEKKTILIVGGSLGARTINLAVQKFATGWVDMGYQILWQTGKGYFATASQFVSESNRKSIFVHEFIRDMDLAYACADLVVSRAGAMSIAELCIVKKPSVFIPSPNVAEDHQTKNAMSLVQRNAAIIVADADAQNSLGKVVEDLITDEERMITLSANMAALAFPNAADAIVAEVFDLLK